MADTRTGIPVVSLAPWFSSDADRAAFAHEVVRICHDIGFLTLVDHGVPDGFTERYFAALEAFFALPEDVKAQVEKSRSPHFRGWERVGSELTDNRVDHREQLDVSAEHPADAPDAVPAYLRLKGPNQWLPEEVLPGFRGVVLEFFDRMGVLAEELMELLAVGLDLPPTTFRERFGELPHPFVKLISYPPTPPGEAGVNGHKDVGFLALVHQHGVGGLEVLDPNGHWIPVPPIRGAIVMNIGEMLQAMTGNYLVATTHRVISTTHRYSSGYFYGPDLRASLAPIPLDPARAAAVAASPRHRDAGFMAKRHELLAGERGTGSAPPPVYGEQLWNYFVRSYPEHVRSHHPDAMR
jgi:isopenicillin N synthase-like dioxygenase